MKMAVACDVIDDMHAASKERRMGHFPLQGLFIQEREFFETNGLRDFDLAKLELPVSIASQGEIKYLKASGTAQRVKDRKLAAPPKASAGTAKKAEKS